ncbi:unnamed protein product [Protopolystoma xenopodis]|uniref:Uncharacterized protein n=1 Tax=Protopolystoma xenopodis TaxID=117903 RepID=A0A3S4ZTY8_9PLAT|nr:unnamed protein product [Protopolystoma xenopodis]
MLNFESPSSFRVYSPFSRRPPLRSFRRQGRWQSSRQWDRRCPQAGCCRNRPDYHFGFIGRDVRPVQAQSQRTGLGPADYQSTTVGKICFYVEFRGWMLSHCCRLERFTARRLLIRFVPPPLLSG